MHEIMGNPPVQTEQPSPAETPLLHSPSHPITEAQPPQPQQQNGDNLLDHALGRLETFLTVLGFSQSSSSSLTLSWFAFIAVGVVLPIVALELFECSDCERYQLKSFEMGIVAFQASLAAVSLLCLSHNLRKYGLRRFLSLDRYTGDIACFHNAYVQQIKGSLRLLVYWVMPCFLLKAAREIIRLIYIERESWWLSVAVLLALIISWTYVSTISLSASILFHLVCNLQVIHFDDYAKLLERESDVLVLMKEHMRLRYHLSKISHRFRIYLLLQFLVVTTSQFVALLQVTEYGGIITFTNGGDFALSTIVQVVGIIICLHAATRISHRAQGIVSYASRWHALVTCTYSDAPQLGNSASAGNVEAANLLHLLYLDYSEFDIEALDCVRPPTNTQLASYMASHHKRQAFVMYLQTNQGGITIFGWTIDRSLVNTIFFLELSLVTFVLSKTIV